MNAVAQHDPQVTCDCGREKEPVPIGDTLHRYCPACDRLWNEEGLEIHAGPICEEVN